MPDSAGINAATGSPLADWEHTKQSIRKILTTPIGSRVMRRDFGSDIPDMIDRKMTQGNVLAVYAAAASALARWEPRFQMRAGRVANATATGVLEIEIHGLYFPRGHVGDYSVVESASTRVVFGG